MNALSTDPYWERECTPKCRSLHHAQQILSCTTKGTPSEVRSYCTWLCFNFYAVVDEFGRNLLHLAASCGKWEVVKWLLDHCHCDVDVRDGESGWTALHRSFFYGQLTVARVLLSHGANLRMTDHEGLTPLDLLVKDRPPHVEYLSGNPLEVYMWGSNNNFNLGLGNDQSREHPEILESFRRQCISIKQVVMCKFHSIFLSNTGKVFTCGHGLGGRLGQRSENTSLVPALVFGLESIHCEQVAAGQDHLILLMEGGQVWTCGLNTYHQLGHSPPPERLVNPKALLLKFLKGKEVIGVCAARFHSVFYTKDSVFTFGLNAGQLGHPKDERSQILPRHVSALYRKDCQITHVVASDGATVCSTDRGDVYVLHEYQQRKIASFKLKIKKISVVGGHLDSRYDVIGVKEGGGLELRILILTESGKVFLWRQSNPFLRRCVFSSGRQLIVSDISLNHYTVAMVTHENEAFMGHILPPKNKKSSIDGTVQVTPTFKSQSTYSQFNPLLEREECDYIRIKRIMYIHRATFISCDSKGRNFAVLQSSPKMGLLDIPVIREFEIQKSMLRLLSEATLDDKFHDVTIKVGAKHYPAHKYILASRSEYFRKQFQANTDSFHGKATVSIENIKPEVFEHVLKFIYTNHCDLLTEGYEIITENVPSSNLDHYIYECENQQLSKKSKKKSVAKRKDQSRTSDADHMKSIKEASKQLGVHVLFKKLEEIKIINGKIRLTDFNCLLEPTFHRDEMKNLYDVKLVSNDGVEFSCHRCILVARLDYFHSMFSFNWMEASSLESLPVDIPSNVIDVVLDFLYTDEALKVLDSEDPEFLCNILIIADQMFIERLKEICEVTLVDLITLKNAPELLHIASACNAVQLKRSCLEYISINLSAIVEMKNLDLLSDKIMDELSSSYRKLVSSMRHRCIPPSPHSPTKNELTDVEQLFPVNQDSDIIKYKSESMINKVHEGKSKNRRRTYSNRGEQKEVIETLKHSNSSVLNDVILDITLDLKDHCSVKERELNFEKPLNVDKLGNSSNIFPTKKLSANCSSGSSVLGDFPELKRIMIEEKTEQKTLFRFPGSTGETRKLSHLSQKQKKMLAAANKEQGNSLAHPMLCHPLPDNGGQCTKLVTSCPWAKLDTQKSPTMSFWDTNDEEKISTFRNISSSVNQPSAPLSPWIKNDTKGPKDVTSFASLKAIQQAEEEKQCSIIPKIKSLHLINIEDQAIEELLVMYKANVNPNEKVTVSRILPEKIAKPVWKKHA